MYGLVGGSDGTLLKFNLQSGLNRGWFPASATSNPSDWGGVRGAPCFARPCLVRFPVACALFSKCLSGGDGKGSKKRPALSAHPLPAPHKDVGKTKGQPNVTAHPSTIDFLFQNVVGVAAKPRGKPKATEKAHADDVTGIATDAMNAKVFTVGSDGYLRVWDFATHARVADVSVGVPITQLETARDSGLLALACEDLTIRVFDAVTLRQVRSFSGHSNRITDVVRSR
jgi:WD40 repeat protein